MGDNPLNSMKGIFNRNSKGNSPKNKNIKKPKKNRGKNPQGNKLNNVDPFANYNQQNQNAQNPNMVNQFDSNIPYQQELSELDKIFLKRMNVIEKEIGRLVADVQYLDSKNPVVSSEMSSILVDLITNVWKIGNIVTTYLEQNQLTIVTQYLSKHENRLLKIIEDSNNDRPHVEEELNELRLCQKIINDSIHPINSSAEYFNVLMSKLSNWGFEVKNPIGQKYDVHMDMDIFAFEGPDPNLKEPMITETKKPEIYLNGNKLAKAQVIVTKAGAKN